MGIRLINSPTLRSAIDLGLRYLDLSFSHCWITVRDEGDAFSLVIDPSLVPAASRRFVAERDIGIVDAMHREFTRIECTVVARAIALSASRHGWC